jgi:hypothetical protein
MPELIDDGVTGFLVDRIRRKCPFDLLEPASTRTEALF